MSPVPSSTALDQDLAAHLDSAWGDPATWLAHGLQWLHLDAVREHIQEQVTGDAAVSPLEWFFQTVGAAQPLPLRRVLVLGCGQGTVERQVARAGWANEIVAIDLSAKVLAVARANAAADGLAIQYLQADMNHLPLGQPGFEPASFDAVLGVSSVHHCADLEHLYASLHRLLVPTGWLFLDEYVGPDRFQFPDHQVRFLNQLLDLLPGHLRSLYDGRVKGNLSRPTVEAVVAIDPSEAVRSSQVLPLLGRHFDVLQRRPYGGAILRVLLSDIAQNFQDAAARPWLHALLGVEEELFRTGRLQRDMACVMARARSQRGGASRPSSAGR